MSPERSWSRFLIGLVLAAVAVRFTVDLIRPIVGFLVAAFVLIGIVVLVRWWRNSRW
jgi:hypothetical protein